MKWTNAKDKLPQKTEAPGQVRSLLVCLGENVFQANWTFLEYFSKGGIPIKPDYWMELPPPPNKVNANVCSYCNNQAVVKFKNISLCKACSQEP